MPPPVRYNTGYNIGVGGAVVRDEKLLLVRRASRRGRGNWQVPGGFIEPDETIEQAVIREVEEESSVIAEVEGVLGLRNRYDPDNGNSLYIVLFLRQIDGIVSFERVFEVLDLEPLIAERPDAFVRPDGPVSVEFDDVRFAYPSADKVSLASLEEVAVLDHRGGAEILHGVSFRAEPGQLIALVGSSGSGKSTIVSLIPRLYDADAGAVRLGGIDVRDLTFESIRETTGMVTQDGHLFHDIVRENLRFARPEATDEELWDALRRGPPRRSRAHRCPTGSTRWSASAATGSPAASVSA